MTSSATTDDAIDKEGIDVAHLATLARLSLTDRERARVRETLTDIVHMIDVIQAIDTQGIEPMAHPLDVTARLRPDEVTEQVDRARFQRGAPATEDGYYLVPRVVE